MFNPLVDSLSTLKDNEIENKIQELSRKYFMAHNPALQQQIGTILEMYKQEIYSRRAIEAQKNRESGNSHLDNLIKVS